MNAKQRAAEAAVGLVHSGMVVGLGTGSTADYFLLALSEALKAGRLRDLRGIPTSRQSERRAVELGIPLTTLTDSTVIDVTVDGADEIDPNLDLIKGLGGALLREKVVAQNSRVSVTVADSSKSVTKLGTRAPLPVEVIRFGYEAHVPFFRELGAEPTLRRASNGEPFVSDNGNYIYDCRFAMGIDNPAALETAFARRAGIVDCGLFVGTTHIAFIADDKNVARWERFRR